MSGLSLLKTFLTVYTGSGKTQHHARLLTILEVESWSLTIPGAAEGMCVWGYFKGSFPVSAYTEKAVSSLKEPEAPCP